MRNEPLILAHLAFAHGRARQVDAATSLLSHLQQLQSHRFVAAYFYALYYSGVSDTQQTLTWLQHAFEEHAPWLVFLAHDFVFDELRGISAFDDLLGRVGVPPLQL
jgi:hypothetical protein